MKFGIELMVSTNMKLYTVPLKMLKLFYMSVVSKFIIDYKI